MDIKEILELDEGRTQNPQYFIIGHCEEGYSTLMLVDEKPATSGDMRFYKAAPQFIDKIKEQQADIHSIQTSASVNINALEASNAQQQETIDKLKEENVTLKKEGQEVLEQIAEYDYLQQENTKLKEALLHIELETSGTKYINMKIIRSIAQKALKDA